jgi:tRNA-dihydrouridine synthase
MREKVEDIRENLRKKLFLSSMMGVTDGSFCSERGEGCAMVQIGAYLAEPPAYGKRECVLPPTEEECVSFFARECERARGESKVYVCLNLATPELEWGLEAAQWFYRAGGDIVELNVHGSYEPYLRLGKLKAMVLPENRSELFRWLEAFSKMEVPVIVKFREGVIPDYTPVLDGVAALDLFGVHFNIRDESSKSPDLEFVREIKRRYPLFLLVSGYVRDVEMARRLFEAGADMVGFAEPTIKDPKFISKIAEELKEV